MLDTDGFVAGTYTVENVDRPAFLVELRNMETGEMHWMEMRDMHDQQVRHASSHEQRVSAETGDTDAADSSGEKKPRLKISADDVRNRQARFEQKRTTYVEENATLSKAEFDALFLGSIRQSNVVGNCGPLATFLSLAAGGENFEAIMRTSIRTTDYGWAVTIPLGKPGGREIKISHANIKTGLHVSLSRKKGQRGLSELDPVSGPQGYQLLEAVLAKLVLGRVDDLQYPVSRRSIEKMRTHVILKKLFGDDVLYTGKKYKGQDTFENPIPGSVCLSSLLAFKPGGKVMTVSIDSGKDSQGNMLPGTFFNYTDLQGSTYNMAAKHFYAITKVNVDSNARPPTVQSVEVVNPHDSSQTMVFPLSDFLNLFDSMQTASIDLNNLFTGGNA